MRDQMWSHLCKQKGWSAIEYEEDEQSSKFKSLYKKAYHCEKLWRKGDYQNGKQDPLKIEIRIFIFRFFLISP